jgi:hypothetical protein
VLILKRLTPLITNCPNAFSESNISECMFSLQGFSTNHAEVRNIVSSITDKLEILPSSLSGKAISGCLYGCSTMTNGCDEVDRLLNVLVQKSTGSFERWSKKEIISAILGIRHMSIENNNIFNILEIILQQILLADNVNGEFIGNCFKGLHFMNKKNSIILNIVDNLSERVNELNVDNTKSNNVVKILGEVGLLKSDCYAVKKLLVSLSALVQRVPLTCTATSDKNKIISSLLCLCTGDEEDDKFAAAILTVISRNSLVPEDIDNELKNEVIAGLTHVINIRGVNCRSFVELRIWLLQIA